MLKPLSELISRNIENEIYKHKIVVTLKEKVFYNIFMKNKKIAVFSLASFSQ